MAELTPRQLAGLALVMNDAGHGPRRRLEATFIAGGRSNLTYRLSDGTTQWVLRTPPRAGRTPSAHAVAREHRVVTALRATRVPVADALLLHEDESLLGGPFTVSAFVEGRTYRTREDLDELDDRALTSVIDSMLAALAALHRVDHVSIGLESFGRPHNYAARQLRRWAGQWAIVGSPQLQPQARDVVERLKRALPAQTAIAVVHGDFRIDNTLIAGVGTRGTANASVAAIIDWELSTIGDPVADIAMMCAYRDPALDFIVGSASAWTSPRIPDPPKLMERYLDAGGQRLDNWEFHLALAYFKIAVIAAGIDHRQRAGAAQESQGFDTAGRSVPLFLDLAQQQLEDVAHNGRSVVDDEH